MDTLPRLVPSLSIRCTRRAWISSLMRGPSFWTGGAVLIGRRMAKDSSAVAPNAELVGRPREGSTPKQSVLSRRKSTATAEDIWRTACDLGDLKLSQNLRRVKNLEKQHEDHGFGRSPLPPKFVSGADRAHACRKGADIAMSEPDIEYLEVGSGAEARAVAVKSSNGGAPGIFWLSGFKSDMHGTKAEALAAWAAGAGRACVRFDYSGHGRSKGEFIDGTISRWLEESLAVFMRYCSGPQVVVGSSMGGWLALLLARELKRKPAGAELAGLVLIAPAVDFTEVLMWKNFPSEVKRELETKGRWVRPSPYDPEGYTITRRLIEDGRAHLLLRGMIETGCPVRILQGVLDPDVPWSHAVELVSRLAQDDVVLTLVKDGDHRLSRPEDIERLIQVVQAF